MRGLINDELMQEDDFMTSLLNAGPEDTFYPTFLYLFDSK